MILFTLVRLLLCRTPEPTVYRVPYTLAATNHILLRARLNGSGPYNFIMDTGAPALFVGEAIAKKLGIKADAQHWGVVDRLEVEGGPVVEKAAARVEGPFQLQAMNQLALTGVNIDGVIGYTVLARFLIDIDMTKPTLAWTPVSYAPPRPVQITEQQRKQMAQPAANQKQMESMAKTAASMFARKPAEVVPRGFVGIEVAEDPAGVAVKRVLASSPAAAAGVATGDTNTGVAISGKADVSVRSLVALREELGNLGPGEVVTLVVRRGSDAKRLVVTTSKGGL